MHELEASKGTAIRARLRVLGRETSLTLKALRTSKLSIAGLVVLLLIAVVAVAAPLIAIQHPAIVMVQGQAQQRWPENLASTLQPPSWQHPFGTDEYGTDIFSKVVYGAQIDMVLPFEAIILSALIGVVIGGIAGYFEGAIGEVLMRITDVFLAVPSIVLALALVASLGPSLNHIMYALVATWWAWYARLIYGETRKVKHRDFVEVARSSGLSGTSVFFRHVLSNVLSPAIIQATSDLGNVLLTVAGLSFLGLGPSPGTAEWGLMISESQNYMFVSWWYPFFPGLAIVVTVLAFNLLGDGLRDVFDPTSRRWMAQEKKGTQKVVHGSDKGARPDGLLLKVEDVSISYLTHEGPVNAVRNVDFQLNQAEAYGLIGESGSGKSTIASAIMGLLPVQSARVSTGDIYFNQQKDQRMVNLLSLRDAEMNRIRGKDISIIFQEVSDSLHPSYRVGFQIGQSYLLHQFETILEIEMNEAAGTYTERPCTSCSAPLQEGEWLCSRCHSIVPAPPGSRLLPSAGSADGYRGSGRGEVLKCLELYGRFSRKNLGPDRPWNSRAEKIVRQLVIRDMRRVIIPDPERTVDLYPFELSGGMKQRVMIAMMMASGPKLLIADEPTTALDVVTERNILDLIKKFKLELGTSILLISHDLNVIRRFCDRVGVIYAGKLVEEGPLAGIFTRPMHPYTFGLIKSLPKVKSRGEFVNRGDLFMMEGSVPELRSVPAGCVFADRCERATEECLAQDPQLSELEDGHLAACFHPMKGEASHGR